ncbi:MAG: SPOR domain-containing protein [Gemmatimonadetes bacterium]|nr:SPOR domain-containing protein [Gemmatimonadota bacterium]
MMRDARALLTALALALAAGPISAQAPGGSPRDTVTLDAVANLIQAGRTEDARDLLLQWWGRVRPSAPAREVQRGLWLRGRLTVDPAQAELDYRRLVVEYPGGPYSAQALFRLAQSAWEVGDSAAAAQHVARLAREYPGSRVRAEAEAWLAAAGSPTPTVNTSSTAQVPWPHPPTQPDTAADTTQAPTPTAAPAASGRYAVQLGAFSTDERARALQAKARDAGFEARLVRVPGSSLTRVRIGRFDSSSAADSLVKRLEALGFTVAVVPDADRERPVRN